MSIPENILKKLIENDANLTTLDISGTKIGNAGATALANILLRNTKLLHLEIRNCGITADGARDFANALKTNKTLQTLYLRGNKIGDEGAKFLSVALKNNSLLKHLFLGNNAIGPDGAKAFAEALMVNRHLETLSLRNNEIELSGAEALVNALKVNSSLHILNLANAGITEVGVKAFAEVLSINTTMQNLNCGHNDVEEEEDLMRDIISKLKYNILQNVVDINEMSKKVLAHCEAYIAHIKRGGGELMSEEEVSQEFRYASEELHYLSDRSRDATAILCLAALSRMIGRYTEKAYVDEILRTFYHLHGNLLIRVQEEKSDAKTIKPRQELIAAADEFVGRVNGVLK